MRANEQRDWKLPVYGADEPTQIEWAMMAAFIDGEGSVLIQSRGSCAEKDKLRNPEAALYLVITVANTDARLILWLLERFGGSFSDSTGKKNFDCGRKTCYHWTASSNRAAWILYNCLPYFVIKKEQADIGIQLQETMLRVRGRGIELSPEVVSTRKRLKQNLLIMKRKGRVVTANNQEKEVI